MIVLLLRLYWEFFLVGLFSMGGGMATVPFLFDLSARTGWFTTADLTTMIAISEATPGPIGVNMATYVGFQVGSIPGAIVATIGLVTPSIIVILIIVVVVIRRSEVFEVFGVKVEVLDEFVHGEAHAKQLLSSLLDIEASLFDLGVDDFVQQLHSTLEFHNNFPP